MRAVAGPIEGGLLICMSTFGYVLSVADMRIPTMKQMKISSSSSSSRFPSKNRARSQQQALTKAQHLVWLHGLWRSASQKALTLVCCCRRQTSSTVSLITVMWSSCQMTFFPFQRIFCRSCQTKTQTRYNAPSRLPNSCLSPLALVLLNCWSCVLFVILSTAW